MRPVTLVVTGRITLKTFKYLVYLYTIIAFR